MLAPSGSAFCKAASVNGHLTMDVCVLVSNLQIPVMGPHKVGPSTKLDGNYLQQQQSHTAAAHTPALCAHLLHDGIHKAMQGQRRVAQREMRVAARR